jgi:hypothetical protein
MGLVKESEGLTCAVAIGDFSHLASIFILLHKIIQLKVRISRKQAIEATDANQQAELLRHLVQVASAVPARLRHAIPRYAPPP